MENVLTAPKGSEIQKDVPRTIMVKDGNNHEVETINLENPDICPRQGVVIVELIRKKNFNADRDITLEVSAYTDKTTGVMWGKKVGVNNQSKEITWKKIKLNPLNIFDRSIKEQAEKCAIILNSPVVEGSPNANFGLTFFRQHDKEKEAHIKIKRIKASKRALQVAESLYGEKLLQMGRNLSMPVTSMSSYMLEAAVLERAEQDPVNFLAIYDNPHYEALSVLNAALEVSLIETESGGYFFKGRPMGHSEGEAIDFLVKNKDIASSIDMQTKSRQSDSIKAMSEKTANIISEEDKDTELTILRKQLADQKALNEKLSAKGIKEAIENPSDDDKWADDIRERAKKCKLKAIHAYKTTDALKKLEKLVLEAEAKLTK